MAWESGLTYNAALADEVREQLELKPIAWLARAIANDKYERTFPGLHNPKHDKAFDRWERKATTLPLDVLVDECLRRAERTNTSDNGGGYVWIDRGGCSKVRLP